MKSFFIENLIDEIYIYTSKNKFENSQLINPLKIDKESWELIEEKNFENDDLKVFRKKELCFQEL